MEKIKIILFAILLIIYPKFNFLIYGQIKIAETPFNIDIKDNIKNIKAIKLSIIGKELKYIPLETTPVCLIHHIYQVEFSESYIFIHDHDRILQFERNGKFIRQIGSTGRGPKEYYNIKDFCIDEQKKEIFIISTPQLLSIFDFDGNFKYAYKLSEMITQIILKDKNNLMYHLRNSPGSNNPSWIITNKKGITLAKIKNNLSRINRPGLTILSSPLYSFENSIHFMEFGIDTLYYFNNNVKKPYAIFYMGDLKLDPDPPSITIKNRDQLSAKLWVGSVKENDEFLFMKLFRGWSTGYFTAIYSKKTNSVTFLKDDVFVNDLHGGAPFWPKQIVNDNTLVDYIDAFDLLKYIVPSDLRRKISESSNPVLMILN